MSDSEEDYMSMIIPDAPASTPAPTSLQRRKEQQRQSELRARQKSKAERAAEDDARRDAALQTSILDAPAHQTSKGLAMMARMGFRPGGALGAPGGEGAAREPIAIAVKEDRGGIGMESEKRRRAREAEEAAAGEEAERRKRVRSKAERAAEDEARRDAALQTSILDAPAHQTSKGLAMMARMGFRPGGALGAPGGEGAAREPIAIAVKEDRGGIGMESEKRRRAREAEEAAAGEEAERRKRVRVEEPGEYRDRIAREREAERVERMVASAQRILEGMAEEAEAEVTQEEGGRRRIKARPLKAVNVLWRGLARQREERERDRRMRHDLEQSLSRLPTYEDEDEDEDDKRALGKGKTTVYEVADDLDEEDPELDEFKILEPPERLKRLVAYMRDEFNYCFWCKFKYPDETMDGCPGLTEEDHD
ncbi:hypothetical protein BN1708_006613 [Verticillium longisporum]|uniref:G-patch domain-containing protein n=3 Tax=Verticillium longisporum TaxID=100787 RepID=A0A0G4MLA1_VERLO|nr:hypothetical protein BN1708_006613 [Verticillium longisporum]